MRPARLVLLIAGVFGAVAGALAPSMQDAVGFAQVSAGVVPYTGHEPFQQLVGRFWSLQQQIPAALLRLGMTERALSILVSALMGALSFQALALTALAALAIRTAPGAGEPGGLDPRRAGGFPRSRRPVVSLRVAGACLVPSTVAVLRLSHAGVAYPVSLFASSYTHGVVGLSFAWLAVVLVATGETAAGAFALGISPAVHAPLGAGALAIVLTIAYWDDALAGALRSRWRWLAAGVGLSAVSLAAHVLTRPPAAAAAESSAAISYAVLRFWDVHHQFGAVPWWKAAALVSVASLMAVAVTGGWVAGRERLVPLFVLVSAAAGLIGHAANLLPREWLPLWFFAAMPGRFLNFAALGGAAFAIGLGLRRAKVLRWAIGAMSAIALVGLCVEIAGAPGKWADLRDRTNDAFYARVAADSGLLLTSADVTGIQLRSRRPVVLDGNLLDAIPYVPSAGPAMARALRALYGVDLLHPPPDSRSGGGALPLDTGRALWASWAPDDWRRIRREWGVTGVIALDDWTLTLTPAAAGDGLAYYVIPE